MLHPRWIKVQRHWQGTVRVLRSHLVLLAMTPHAARVKTMDEVNLHPDGVDKTRYYKMIHLPTEIYYTFTPFTMLPCPVETREPVIIAGSSRNDCE